MPALLILVNFKNQLALNKNNGDFEYKCERGITNTSI
jgi:hypothetical protein